MGRSLGVVERSAGLSRPGRHQLPVERQRGGRQRGGLHPGVPSPRDGGRPGALHHHRDRRLVRLRRARRRPAGKFSRLSQGAGDLGQFPKAGGAHDLECKRRRVGVWRPDPLQVDERGRVASQRPVAQWLRVGGPSSAVLVGPRWLRLLQCPCRLRWGVGSVEPRRVLQPAAVQQPRLRMRNSNGMDVA